MPQTINLADEFAAPDEAVAAKPSEPVDLAKEFSLPATQSAEDELRASGALPKKLDFSGLHRKRDEKVFSVPDMQANLVDLPQLPEMSATEESGPLTGIEKFGSSAAGVYNKGAALASSFTTLPNIALLLSTGGLGNAARLGSVPARRALVGIGAYFAGTMGKDAIEQIPESKKIIDAPDSSPQEIAGAIAGPVFTAAMSVFAALGAVHEARPDLAKFLKDKTPAEAETILKAEALKTESPQEKAVLQDAADQIATKAQPAEATPEPSVSAPAPTPEIDKLAAVRGGAEKLNGIKTALKSPGAFIQYSVWDVPPGMDRVLQADVIDPTNPQPGGNGSTNRSLLKELGIDAPPAPDWLPQGSYTLDEIKAEIAKGPPNERGAAPSALTPDAKALLDSIDKGGAAPAFISKNLERIARENGVEITDKMRPADVIDAIRKVGETKPNLENEFTPPSEVTASAPEIGLGAASPAEFKPVKEFAVSLKNESIDKERAARGAPPLMEVAKKDNPTLWNQAMKVIDENQNAADDLIALLKETPRAVTDVEQAVLLHREIDLKNQLEKASKNLAEKVGTEDSLASDRLTRARVLDELSDLETVSKSAGTETSRGLNARKLIAKEDYSLARMLTERRAEKGGEALTEQEIAETEALHKKIEETRKALNEYENAAGLDAPEPPLGNSVQKIIDEISSEKPTAPAAAKTEVESAIDSLRSAVRDDPEVNDGSYIQRVAESFVRSGIKEREALIDAVHKAVKDIIPGGITRRQTMDAISGYGDFRRLDPDAIKAELRDLKGQMQQVGKLQDMEAGRAPAKTGGERRIPSDEERRLIKQVEEAKRKGGFNVTDPAKQLKSALASIKTRLQNSIRDLEQQIATKTQIVKGKTSVALDAEATALKAIRDKLKAEYDSIFGKPDLTDVQKIALAEKSADRQIEELQRQLKNDEVFPAGSKPELKSASLEAKRAQIDALKEEREYARQRLQPKEDRTKADIALQAFKTRAASRIADLQRRLANSDFAKKAPREPIQLDEKAVKLKAENQRAKQAFDEALLKDRLAKRTTLEKAQDTLVKWRRGFLLSSPITLAKLTSAAIQRMTITPIEELVGAGIGKLIPSVASRAPREGGINVTAEARAITQGLTKGLSDAAELIKTGKTNLEVLFGKGREGAIKESDVTPRSVIDFFGEIHGALKAPVKRAEFTRSLEKRMAFAIKNGIDATDPLVQTRLMVEAYKDANRSIFLQDNIVVNAYNRALGALLEKQKATGKPSTSGKVLATTAKVLLPIVRVPTNIVAETITNATGLVTGSFRLARILGQETKKLSPDQADLVMRELKKGSLGAAVLLIGYFNADKVGGYYQSGQKRSDKDVPYGSVKVYGNNVPSYLLHNPLIETLQLGATIKRVAESKLHKKDRETQGLDGGIWAAGLGLIEEVPFVRQQVETAKMLDSREGPYARGEFAKSLVVPQAVEFTARQLDKDAKGNVIQRKPATTMQHIETAIPGLRKNVPKK